MPYERSERELFERIAVPLYEHLVAVGGVHEDDARLDDPAQWAAFELLCRTGLLVLQDDRWVPVDPSVVASSVVAPLGQLGVQMLQESAAWAQAFTALGQSWRRAPATVSDAFTEVRGEAVAPYLAALIGDAEEEVLTAEPESGRNADALTASAEREVAALARGVRIRTLHQHSARRSRHLRSHVDVLTDAGAEVRTSDELFDWLVVVDRRVAVVPGADGAPAALAVREASVVAYLVDVFERSWQRGRPFARVDEPVESAIAAEQRAMTIRMLISGHPDSASAVRLGVSPRTYASYVAALKAEFDVQTRFQLGYEMARRGVSGTS